MLTYKRNLTIIRPMPFGVALKVQVEGPTSGATEVSSLQLALEVEPKSQTQSQDTKMPLGIAYLARGKLHHQIKQTSWLLDGQ